ncbi:hypothetical protein BSM4216_2531 [Bacillus smithii]|nr:hypothetical protein BSM4216_2531 [Bacillus smithii]
MLPFILQVSEMIIFRQLWLFSPKYLYSPNETIFFFRLTKKRI